MCFYFYTNLYRQGFDKKKKLIIDSFAKAAIEFQEEAQKNNATFILFIFPKNEQIYEQLDKNLFRDLDVFYPIEKFKDTIGKKVILYDLIDDQKNKAKLVLERDKEYIYWRFDNHWNPLVYSIAASLIEDFLSKQINPE